MKVDGGTTTLLANGAITGTGGTAIEIDSGTLVFGEGSGTINGNVLDNGLFAINRSTFLTYGGVISGSGAFAQTGSGTTELTGVNTYMGGTTLSGGTLSVSQEANLGDPSGGLTFNGGILQITGTTFNSTPRPIIWGTGGGGFDIANSANVFTVNQVLGGPGGLTKLGAGTLVLSGANSYSGGTTLAGGTLSIGADNNIGTGSLAMRTAQR